MGSVRMITKQVLCLFLIHLLTCAGQELGSKSRFDAILSKFGFGENPVHLEQAAPSFASEKIKVSEPIKKIEVSNDKKKFSKALQKFGFETATREDKENTKLKENFLAKEK